MTFLTAFIVRIYRMVVSPILHAAVPVRSGCRFSPTCSEFLEDAVRQHGVFRGVCIGLGRVARCHPFAESITRNT